MKTRLVTLSTRNRLAEVAVLAESLARHHPEAVLTCYLVEADVLPGDRIGVNVDVKGMKVLPLSDPRRLTFQYSAFELCCALKPHVMLDAMSGDVERVVYLDGDFYACAPFLDQMEAVENALTVCPHLYRPCMDTDYPYFLRAGVYNAGLISAHTMGKTREILRWWADRLATACIQDVAAGVFVDQSWLCYALGIWGDTGIFPADAGLNIGHWNLHEFEFSEQGDVILAGKDMRLRLFHFSGFEPTTLTRHPTVAGEIPGVIRRLADDYGRALAEARNRFPLDAPYSYGCFPDGTEVTREMREAVRRGLIEVPDPWVDPGAMETAVQTLGTDRILDTRIDFQLDRFHRLCRRVEELEASEARLLSAGEALQSRLDLVQSRLDQYRRQPIRTYFRDPERRDR